MLLPGHTTSGVSVPGGVPSSLLPYVATLLLGIRAIRPSVHPLVFSLAMITRLTVRRSQFRSFGSYPANSTPRTYPSQHFFLTNLSCSIRRSLLRTRIGVLRRGPGALNIRCSANCGYSPGDGCVDGCLNQSAIQAKPRPRGSVTACLFLRHRTEDTSATARSTVQIPRFSSALGFIGHTASDPKGFLPTSQGVLT